MDGDEQGVEAGRWTAQDRAAWYDARGAMVVLRDALIAAGLAKDFPYLRADLNAFGQGLVDVGRTTPDAAKRVSELITRGLSTDPSLVEQRSEGGTS